MNRSRALPALLLCATAVAACGSDDTATASFESPADGATIAGGVRMTMAAEGITIEEAGEARDGAGHFHVIADEACTATGETIGKDADHVHFGKAQAEGVIYLEPGSHDLCLQVGDGVHTALGVTDTITIDVGITTRDDWCVVVGETDELFEAVDTSSDDFATKQIGYENVNRLVLQLIDGLAVVDPDAHDDVQTAMEFASDIATAFTTADSLDEAERALEPVFEAVYDGELPGADWIRDTCDVNIDA